MKTKPEQPTEKPVQQNQKETKKAYARVQPHPAEVWLSVFRTVISKTSYDFPDCEKVADLSVESYRKRFPDSK